MAKDEPLAFEMKDLVNKTGDYIEIAGSGRGNRCLLRLGWDGLSVAGVLVKDSDWLLENLHVTPIENNEIVLPRGHNVNFGAPVGTMVAFGGGKCVEAGYANGMFRSAAATAYGGHSVYQISPLRPEKVCSAWSRLRWWRVLRVTCR